jgi:hypothetical protein
MKKQPVSWQRLTLSLIGIVVLAVFGVFDTWHLYSLPDYTMPAYQSITNNRNYVMGAIVIFMVTGRLIYEWKNSTTSAANSALEIIREKREERIDHNEKIVQDFNTGRMKDEDYSEELDETK